MNFQNGRIQWWPHKNTRRRAHTWNISSIFNKDNQYTVIVDLPLRQVKQNSKYIVYTIIGIGWYWYIPVSSSFLTTNALFRFRICTDVVKIAAHTSGYRYIYISESTNRAGMTHRICNGEQDSKLYTTWLDAKTTGRQE